MIVFKDVEHMLKMGVVHKVNHVKDKQHFHMGKRKKGQYRPKMNKKPLNTCVHSEKFKMGLTPA